MKEQLPDKFLEENLTTFTGLLRKEGLPVGTTEVIDALSALEKIDLFSRSCFKAALQSTLVKNRRDQIIFSRIFDLFFIASDEHLRRSQYAEMRKKESEQQLECANRELVFKGEMLQLSPAELRQYSSLSAEKRRKIRDFVQKTETGHNVEPQFKPILEAIVKSHLRYRRSDDEREKRSAIASQQADGAGAQPGPAGEEELREMDIEMIAASELPAAEELLQRLSRKLAVQILRRKYSGSHSSLLDLRRSMRDNMCYGGIIFNLKHKPKRRSKRQILLLCDVSASMHSYSTFVIHFLHGLHEAVRDLSCMSFSDQLEDLTEELKGRTNLKQLLDRVIRRSSTWGGGTNIGSALRSLREKYPGRLNAKTTLLIVSDTKTIKTDQAIAELKMIKELVRRVIWLNPLPTFRWPDYRSVSQFAEEVEMWPCSTIAQLEQVLSGRL